MLSGYVEKAVLRRARFEESIGLPTVPLRVLVIEASEADFLSLVGELKNSGYEPFCIRVQTASQFRQALREKWDVILGDCELPRFSALDALRILHEKSIDIPFVVVASAQYQCHVREVFKAGASDFIRKDELARLHVALDRELRAAEGRHERRHLEDQLRHAQKLEAVGRLAGGVAHDFNNLLTIISGYSELLLAGDDLQRSQRAALDEIRRAAQRGGALTHQLLAFSRRQPMAASIVHINDLLMNMEKMLRRLIGEDIELVTLPAATEDTVKTDPGRLEQVIMNLVVNARDAMPNGGKLTIEAGTEYLDEADVAQHVDVKPGPHVVLTISRYGRGDGRRDALPSLRAFLHHQGAGARNRAGAGHRLRHHPPERRFDLHCQRTGARRHGDDLPSARCGRRGSESGSRGGAGGAERLRDRPAGGGRAARAQADLGLAGRQRATRFWRRAGARKLYVWPSRTPGPSTWRCWTW